MASRLDTTIEVYARLLVPHEYREGFAGDLLEQPPKRVLAEMVRSIPALLALRLRSLRTDGGGPVTALALGLVFLGLAIAALQLAGRGVTSAGAVFAGLTFASEAYLPISQVTLPVLVLTGAVVGSASGRAPVRNALWFWLTLTGFGLATQFLAGPGVDNWHESLRLLLPLPLLIGGSALAPPRRGRLA